MKRQSVVVAIALLALAPLAPAPADAIPFAAPVKGLEQREPLIQKVVVVRRAGGGAVAVRRPGGVGRPGWHGGGAAVVRPGWGGAAVVRPGWHGGGVRYGGWVRPSRYWWGPGGAIAAGAAIGFVTAAAAASWAGAAPGPNMCWYYTDPSRTNGFWDVCQ